MKLYVWEKVLCDYTCGMIVAVAEDLEGAIETARKEGVIPPYYVEVVTGEMGRVEPEIYELSDETPPLLFTVSGGG